MFYYKVIHKYKLIDHCERKNIGFYSSYSNAKLAIEELKIKEGFKDTIDCFKIKKVIRFIKPKLIDKTFWADGFDYYTYVENINKNISCDETLSLLKDFSFLIKDYGFNFDKVELGDYRGSDGKLYFYGPYNCYSFYTEGVSINFLNFVQRHEWNITITDEFINDQNYLNEGLKIESRYEYDWTSLAFVLKEDLESKHEVFGKKIKNK